jgi:hypothetical protein
MEKIVGESVKDRGLEESVQERMEAGATGKDLNMQKLKADVLAAPAGAGPGALASMLQRLRGRGRLAALRCSRTAANTHTLHPHVRLHAL